MEYPYLKEGVIEAEAGALLHAVFGGRWHEREPVDLATIVYEHLSPRDNLIFNDDADLPAEGGETVLGKTLPLQGKILLSRELKNGECGRARFTLGHEIGHWVLHRKLFLARRATLDLFVSANAPDDDFALVGLNKSVFPGSCRPGTVAREEWQANRFAISILKTIDAARYCFAARSSSLDSGEHL